MKPSIKSTHTATVPDLKCFAMRPKRTHRLRTPLCIERQHGEDSSTHVIVIRYETHTPILYPINLSSAPKILVAEMVQRAEIDDDMVHDFALVRVYLDDLVGSFDLKDALYKASLVYPARQRIARQA